MSTKDFWTLINMTQSEYETRCAHYDVTLDIYNNEKTMTLAVVGSRDFEDWSSFEIHLKDIIRDIETKQHVTVTTLVSGGAKGVDTLAEEYATVHKLRCVRYDADWNTFGRIAGNARSLDIVDRAHHVVAFWDGQSPGTKHTIAYAKRRNKPLTIVQVDP